MIKIYNIIKCVRLVDPKKTNTHVDCINYAKFNKVIPDLHEPIEKYTSSKSCRR
jgi:hypothetical protein